MDSQITNIEITCTPIDDTNKIGQLVASFDLNGTRAFAKAIIPKSVLEDDLFDQNKFVVTMVKDVAKGLLNS